MADDQRPRTGRPPLEEHEQKVERTIRIPKDLDAKLDNRWRSAAIDFLRIFYR